MKLFFDESVGATVPSALQHVGAPCAEIVRPTRAGSVTLGTSDLAWLAIAGREGYLVITHDFGILEVPAEKATLVASRVGAVFIPGGTEPRWKVLRLLLRHWELLERIDATEARPFAFHMPMRGHPRRLNLV